MMDRMVLQIIQANTHKTVIPVNMPRSLCTMSLSIRSMTWSVTQADAAQKLVDAARFDHKNRAV